MRYALKMNQFHPIPIGWTVRVYRSERENGIAIHARHEQGREFTVETYTNSAPSPVEEELPSGGKRVFAEVVHVSISDDALLSFLWSRALEKIRKWETSGRWN